MNRQTFIELTGEDPVDMFGPDWENEMLAIQNDEEDEDEEEEDEETQDNDITGDEDEI